MATPACRMRFFIILLLHIRCCRNNRVAEVALREEEALSSNGGPRSASPQCQPTTVRKDNNLDRIEHTVHTFLPASQVRITRRRCR